MSILIIHGPNLNVLPNRNPNFYDNVSEESILKAVKKACPNVKILFFQSNSEGKIIDRIQQAADDNSIDGVIINPGAYAHYSYAIADAINDAAYQYLPIVEVHISNIHRREEFRARSVTAASAEAIISGAGEYGYVMAAHYLIHLAKERNPRKPARDEDLPF